MFSDPEKNVKQFGLREGMNVADLGAGSGYYSMYASKIVGVNGKVFAVEIQQEVLYTLKKEAERANISNIEIIWGDVEKPGGTKLKDDSMDAVILSNILFQTEDRNQLVKETKRILKVDGKVLLVDWSDSFNSMGPIDDHVVKEHKAKELFEKFGFVFKQNIEAGSPHYGMIFSKE